MPKVNLNSNQSAGQNFVALRFREGPNSLGIRLVLDARFLQSPANLHGKTYLLKRWAGPLCTNAQAVTAWLAVRILLLLLLLFRGLTGVSRSCRRVLWLS